jgi:hypothetical protein
MKMYVMATKLVPCLLGELQKEIHVSTCQDIPERFKRDPEFFLKIMTTGDETWICECDPATNQPPSEWRSIITSSLRCEDHVHCLSAVTELCIMNLFYSKKNL